MRGRDLAHYAQDAVASELLDLPLGDPSAIVDAGLPLPCGERGRRARREFASRRLIYPGRADTLCLSDQGSLVP